MKKSSNITRRFEPKKNIKGANLTLKSTQWRIKIIEGEYVWDSKMDRVNIIRKGLPYESIEVISERADLPVKQVLHLFGFPHTTYNKKRGTKIYL